MNNQVIDVMSTVLNNTNTESNTTMTVFNDSLNKREKILLAILIYYRMLEKDDQSATTSSYNECTLEACRPFFDEVINDEDMAALYNKLIENYKRDDGMTGNTIRKTWGEVLAKRKSQRPFLPSRF